MSPDRTPAAPEPEPEVDLSRYFWAVVGRWWLLALGIALGVLVGYLVSLGGGRLFQARATVYLGQPLTPSSNAQVQGLQTNPSTVNQIVRSESVVRAVAAEVGVDAEDLRERVTSRAVAGTVARGVQTQLVEVSVRGPWRRQSAEAANLLAETVVQRVSGYPEAKIRLLEALLASQQSQIEALDDTIERYREAVAGGEELGATERLVTLGLLDNAEQERGRLTELATQTELSLALAREVERAKVVTRAAASRVAARGRGSSMIVGAVLGLLVGIVLALLWEPLRSRVPGLREP